MDKKVRIDQHLVITGLFASKNKAQSAIMAGEVLVNGNKVDKCGTFVQPDAQIEVLSTDSKFVGRGGEKLVGALDLFKIPVEGKSAMDIGASTGGFTDCLLQRGCKLIYAIDVGYGQLDNKIRKNKHVVPIERTNARHLDWPTFEQIAAKAIKNEIKQEKDLTGITIEPVDIIVMDVSFISIIKILPALKHLLKADGEIISLVKPQFEATREQVGKGGIITDSAVHTEVLNRVQEGSIAAGYKIMGTCDSPIKGTMGNKEFFIHLKHADSFPEA